MTSELSNLNSPTKPQIVLPTLGLVPIEEQMRVAVRLLESINEQFQIASNLAELEFNDDQITATINLHTQLKESLEGINNNASMNPYDDLEAEHFEPEEEETDEDEQV